MTEGRESPHAWHLAVTSRTPCFRDRHPGADHSSDEARSQQQRARALIATTARAGSGRAGSDSNCHLLFRPGSRRATLTHRATPRAPPVPGVTPKAPLHPECSAQCPGQPRFGSRKGRNRQAKCRLFRCHRLNAALGRVRIAKLKAIPAKLNGVSRFSGFGWRKTEEGLSRPSHEAGAPLPEMPKGRHLSVPPCLGRSWQRSSRARLPCLQGGDDLRGLSVGQEAQ